MEKRYDPSSNQYQFYEFFGAGEPSEKGYKVIEEAKSYLSGRPQLKNRIANKAIDLAGLFGPQVTAAVTLGFSRIFSRSLSIRSSTKAIPTMEFDRSQIQATWPQGKSTNT